MATTLENTETLRLAFSTHMKNKNPGVDAQTTANIDEFALAYASAIAGVLGEGSSGTISGDYIQKSGGVDAVMGGKFTANDGFEAGYGFSQQILTTENGLLLVGNFLFDGVGMSKDEKRIITSSDTLLSINGADDFSDGVYLGGTKTLIKASLQIGETDLGFFVDSDTIQYKTKNLLHSGNANLPTVDWTMKDASIGSTLSVGGTSTFLDNTLLLYGLSAGIGGVEKMKIVADGIQVSNKLILPSGGEIFGGFNDASILSDFGNGSTTLSAAGEDLHIGYENTKKVILSANLCNFNGSRTIIDKYGAGTMNWGFSAGIDSEEKMKVDDDGVTFFDALNLLSVNTKIESGDSNAARITTPYGYIDMGVSSLNVAEIKTDKNTFSLNKPAFSVKFGIIDSSTRMEDNKLLLNDSNYLYSVADGIKHFGNSYITQNIGTASFSSGFSGDGWRITPESEATFTDLVIRRKLKVYEFEVQKITAVNGSFWISSNGSAESVIKL